MFQTVMKMPGSSIVLVAVLVHKPITSYRFTGTLRVIRHALPKFQRLNSEELPLFLPG